MMMITTAPSPQTATTAMLQSPSNKADTVTYVDSSLIGDLLVFLSFVHKHSLRNDFYPFDDESVAFTDSGMCP
jgi:hypothetical protein